MKRWLLAIGISLGCHALTALIPPYRGDGTKPTRVRQLRVKISKSSPPPAPSEQPQPTPVAKRLSPSAAGPKKVAKSPARSRAKTSTKPTKVEPSASIGQTSRPEGGAKGGAKGGYQSLLPGAGVDSQGTQNAYGEYQRQQSVEKGLRRSGRRMSSVTVRLARLLEERVSIPAVIKKHLGIRSASVLLVNEPKKGAFLRNLRGEPVLRAMLFKFLRDLTRSEEWQELAQQGFALRLELRTELGERDGVRTIINSGTITGVATTKLIDPAAKYFTVTESSTGEVQAGINVLALIAPVLSSGDRRELDAALAKWRDTRGYESALRFFSLTERR